MSDLPARRATRVGTARWLDVRVVLGVLLVLASVVIGARVFASADRYTSLYVAAHPLVPGEHLTASDVTVGRVRLDGQGANYISAGSRPPVGYVVQRYVGAGEFLPVRAIAAASTTAPDRMVTLPVQPGHLPPGVGPGALIDLYVSPKTSAGGAAKPQLVGQNLAVQSRQGGTGELSASSVDSLVVAVPAPAVAGVVQAVESGSLDVVVVPSRAAAALGSPPAVAPSSPGATP